MKQVILMRKDIKMSVGKMCAQSAHASIKPDAATIVVSVSRLQLATALTEAETVHKLKVKWIFDAGHTEVPPETLTCGCIYGEDKIVDKVTGKFKTL